MEITKKTRCMIAMLLTILTAACSTVDDAEPVGGRMLLRVDAVANGLTRADNNIQGSAFLTDELVNVWEWDAGVHNSSSAAYSYSSEVSTVYTTKTMKVNSSNALVANDGGKDFEFPESNKANIRAVYPTKAQYSQTTDVNMASLRSASATFTVQTDQSTAANYKASDLMYGLPTNGNPITNTGNPVTSTGTSVPMTFRHMMAKVNITITAGQGIDYLDGIAVMLYAATTATLSVDATTKDLTVAATGAAAQAITVNSSSQVSGKTTVTLSVVIPPQEFRHDNTFITIKRGTVTYTYAPTNDISFLSGSLNNFNITMELYKLTVTGNITPWNSQGDEKTFTGTVS